MGPISRVAPEDLERLLDDAFGTERLARTAYLLRLPKTEIGALSFAIWHDRRLVGSIQCWPVKVGDTKLVLVGPVAVAPDRQGTGLGHQLMHSMLDAAAAIGNPPMVMIGDPEYYGRFGFTDQETAGWTMPGPWEQRRLLVHNITGQILPAKGLLERADAL